MGVTTVTSVTEQHVFSINESSYYELYSIATPSFTLPYTLTIYLLHFIKQQLANHTI